MTDLQIVYVVVFAVMSIVGFLSMYVDKTKAKRRKWRTPEWVLFLIAVLFGGVGSTAGMYVFRHKTRHWYFKVFYAVSCGNRHRGTCAFVRLRRVII